MEILIKPIISEKTVRLADELNQYTFAVNSRAGKISIAQAVAAKFSVTVENVRVINTLGKKVSFGKKRQTGRQPATKKAIVTLKEGDSIEIFKLQ